MTIDDNSSRPRVYSVFISLLSHQWMILFLTLAFLQSSYLSRGYLVAPGGVQTGADKGNTRKRRSVDSSDSETSESQGLIQSLRDEIESIKRPSGTQKNPARTCRDLYMCNGNINDGKYSLWALSWGRVVRGAEGSSPPPPCLVALSRFLFVLYHTRGLVYGLRWANERHWSKRPYHIPCETICFACCCCCCCCYFVFLMHLYCYLILNEINDWYINFFCDCKVCTGSILTTVAVETLFKYFVTSLVEDKPVYILTSTRNRWEGLLCLSKLRS